MQKAHAMILLCSTQYPESRGTLFVAIGRVEFKLGPKWFQIDLQNLFEQKLSKINMQWVISVLHIFVIPEI